MERLSPQLTARSQAALPSTLFHDLLELTYRQLQVTKPLLEDALLDLKVEQDHW